MIRHLCLRARLWRLDNFFSIPLSLASSFGQIESGRLRLSWRLRYVRERRLNP